MVSSPIFAIDRQNCPASNPITAVQVVSCDEQFRECPNDDNGPHKKVTINPAGVNVDWATTVTNNVVLFGSDNTIETITIQGTTLSADTNNDTELVCIYDATDNDLLLAEELVFADASNSRKLIKANSESFSFEEKEILVNNSPTQITLIESITSQNITYKMTLKDTPISMSFDNGDQAMPTAMSVGGPGKSGQLTVTNGGDIDLYTFDLNFSCDNAADDNIENCDDLRNFGNPIPARLASDPSRELYGFPLRNLLNQVVGYLRIDIDNEEDTKTEVYLWTDSDLDELETI